MSRSHPGVDGERMNSKPTDFHGSHSRMLGSAEPDLEPEPEPEPRTGTELSCAPALSSPALTEFIFPGSTLVWNCAYDPHVPQR